MRRHVYYYELVDAPHEVAARVLADDPTAWLPAPALRDGDGWLVDLRAEGALPPALSTRRARVRVGAPAEGPSKAAEQAPPHATVLRVLTWEAASGTELFPVLSADLELAALGGGGSQLSLRGSYRPPLSVVGDTADRLLGHRVAEASVRRFVLDVAGRLARPAQTPPA